MSEPIPDAPLPDVQDAGIIDAGFSVGPPAFSLCGINFPTFKFHLSLNINLDIPFPPTFFFAIGLNCDLNDPLSVKGGIGFGGGRKASFDTAPGSNDTTG